MPQLKGLRPLDSRDDRAHNGGNDASDGHENRLDAAQNNLDGMRYNSRFAGQVCAALFPPAQTAMPSRPALSLPLTHPELASGLAGAARRLGYLVI